MFPTLSLSFPESRLSRSSRLSPLCLDTVSSLPFIRFPKKPQHSVKNSLVVRFSKHCKSSSGLQFLVPHWRTLIHILWFRLGRLTDVCFFLASLFGQLFLFWNWRSCGSTCEKVIISTETPTESTDGADRPSRPPPRRLPRLKSIQDGLPSQHDKFRKRPDLGIILSATLSHAAHSLPYRVKFLPRALLFAANTQ